MVNNKMDRDLICSYVAGKLIGKGISDRSGDIMTEQGIFFETTTEFFTYTLTEWRAREHQVNTPQRPCQ
jgi:hypothetical protein